MASPVAQAVRPTSTTSAVLERLAVSVYRIPTDAPEADGTYAWDSTTMVFVETFAAGHTGIGWSYASEACASLIRGMLWKAIERFPVDDNGAAWEAMVRQVRNVGREGIASTAISAIDIALWDLKAKILGQPLHHLLGVRREAVPIYGSGGFTTYTDSKLAEQLSGWVEQGIPRVKMKLGTDWGTKPDIDVQRVEVARRAIGDRPQLFVDANGAYTAKQAISQAKRFYEVGRVSYFEEPVSSDHLDELRFVREHAPMDIAAGEYGWDPWYFKKMLGAGAVDIMQADATRCLGITGWLRAADLAYSFAVPFSAHCGPSIHAVAGCAAPQLSHIEYFHDHVRIEHMLFDGALDPKDGCLRPDPSRPGLGLELKRREADRFRIEA